MKRNFNPEDLVYAQIHDRNATKWIPGQVIEHKDSVNYAVLLETGCLIQAYTNQLRQRYSSANDADPTPRNQLSLSFLIDEFQLQVPNPMVPENQP